MSRKPPQPAFEFLKIHLTLGRVSNLPTIWADCAAAWALASGAFNPVLFMMMAAMSCFYVGGMYLNDALDAEWDQEHGIARPITQGRIARNTVFMIACALLATGLMLTLYWGWLALFWGLLLVGAIVAYNARHNQISWSPVLMGLCRALVYWTVAFAARPNPEIDLLIVWPFSIGLYIVGLSYVAKFETSNTLKRYGPLALLYLPAFLNLYRLESVFLLLFSFAQAAWVSLTLYWVIRPETRDFRRAVSLQIAGICLVDLIASLRYMGTGDPYYWPAFILGCFALTLISQRYVPST